MSTNDEYSRRQGGAHRPRRNIEFFDPDFDADTTPSHEDYYPRRNNARDDRDYDYDDRDYDDRSYEDDRGYDDRDYNDGTYEDNSYDNEAYDDSGYDDSGYDNEPYDDVRYDAPYPPREPQPVNRDPQPVNRDPQPVNREPQPAPRDSDQGYRAGYRDGFRDNEARAAYPPQGGNGALPPESNQDMDDEKSRGFVRRHPILMNLIYACAAGLVLIYMALWFLDLWTFHGQERAVPDVKGQSFETATANISRAGLNTVVTDSVYDNYARPGTVAEQSPIPNSKIKKGGNVYLTIVAFTPKMVTIPDIYDVSERQARSMLEGLGITQIMTVSVPSEYEGLVMGAKFNGVSLRPGARVPISAVITLEVGEGYDTFADSTSDTLVDSVAIEEAIEVLNID